MAALLFYKTIVSFYQAKLLSKLDLLDHQQTQEFDEESVVITCKPPSGMTRQERYERIKALMNR